MSNGIILPRHRKLMNREEKLSVPELKQLLQEYEIVIEMQKDEIQAQKDLRRQDREAIAIRAREIASMYPQYSDGRNTFIIFADWIDNAK